MRTRTIVVSPLETGRAVAALLRAHLRLSWSQARRLVDERRVRVGRELCREASRRLKPGQRVVVRLEDRPEPPAKKPPAEKIETRPRYQGPPPVLRHVDANLVVVDKPAGLTTMRHAEEAAEHGARAQRYLPPTLADLLPELLPADRHGRKPRPRAVHRLDRDTSGLVVFARTAEAERRLGQEFRAHGIGRRYLALVRGQAREGTIESNLVRDRGDARRGSSAEPGAGKYAVTHIHIVEELGDFTLVECRLETGRTHQVRIHLAEQGTPICGERVYDRPLHGAPLPDESGATRLALHAAYLEFAHPATGKRLAFESSLPEDMAKLLKRLRGRQGAH